MDITERRDIARTCRAHGYTGDSIPADQEAV